MSVFRIEKNDNYTIMSNYHLRDRRLSYKAKGLLSFMLSLPDDWYYSLNGLCSISKEGRDGIRSILKELQDNHYIKIEKVRDDKGHFEYNYLIYETPYPVKLERNNNPDMENPYMDSPHTENHTQINTNIQNTKEQTDKEDKTKNKIFEDNHNFLTIDLIDRKYITKDDTDIYNYDKFFENLLIEYETKDLLIILHYIIARVLDHDFVDENGEKIANKFGYLKNSILNNIARLKNNELEWDEELGWFKDVEEDLDEEIEIW